MSTPIENTRHFSVKTSEYRHSFAHLLAAAVKKLYPEVKFGIGPTIDNGFYYDFALPSEASGEGRDNAKISEEDLPKIQKEMIKIAKQGHAFKKEEWEISKAREHFKKEEATYKLQLIDDLEKSGEKKVGMVHMGDVFLDLCKGGHAEGTKDLPLDAFKLTRVAGAYWRGDEKNPMLTRVYGVAFENNEELNEYLKQQEEATKRDHKKLGKELGFFVFSDLVGPGLPLYKPKGSFVLSKIIDLSKSLRNEIGYMEIRTPQINKAELFKTSGHYSKYKNDMFRVSSNYSDEEYYLKPMNCPQHTQVFASEMHSYKDMPTRFSDFSILYRDEKPGELAGLARLRAFSQDDAHCFCTEDQIKAEFSLILGVIQKAMQAYNMDYWIRLSLRDESNKEGYLGDDEIWQKSQVILKNLLDELNIDYKSIEGEAAFYGPKMDLMGKDSLGREWQLSTIQLDFNMPQRFGLEYIDETGNKKTPVMIHSALVGSPERFLGVLIEHYAGAFPFWLAPEQIWIVPVSEKFNDYAHSILTQMKDPFPPTHPDTLRVSIKKGNDTLGKKIREGQVQKIPYLIIVGEKEEKDKKISIRHREKGDIGLSTVKEFVENVIIEAIDITL